MIRVFLEHQLVGEHPEAVDYRVDQRDDGSGDLVVLGPGKVELARYAAGDWHGAGPLPEHGGPLCAGTRPDPDCERCRPQAAPEPEPPPAQDVVPSGPETGPLH